MTDAENIEIKKRARRRLVGAIALVLLAAIVLPMMMEQEPHPSAADIQITIPGRDTAVGTRPIVPPTEAALASSLVPDSEEQVSPALDVPPLPAAQPEMRPEPAVGATPKPEPIRIEPAKPEPPKAEPPKPASLKPEPPKPSAESAEAARALAILEGREVPRTETFVLQIGAFADSTKAESIRADLRKQGFAAYTEKAGNVTRVRVGPVTGRPAADKLANQLKALGFSTVITPR